MPRRLLHQTQGHPLILNLSSPMKTTCQSLKAAVSYADLKWSLRDFINTSFTKYENNDAALRNFQQILNLFMTDHNTSMKMILANLKEVQDDVKEDPALNKKVLKAAEAYTRNSSNLIELLSLVKIFDFPCLKSVVENLQAATLRKDVYLAAWARSSTSMAWNLGPKLTNIELTQATLQSDISSLRQDTLEINSVMNQILNAFKGHSSSAPSSSVPTTTLAITEGLTIVEGGGNYAHTANKETPSHTEGEKADMNTDEVVEKEPAKEPKKEKLTNTTLTFSIPHITPPSQPESPQVTLRTDRGKRIAMDDTAEPTKKIMPASRKVHHDPDALILVKKAMELRKKILDNYIWITTSRLKPELITDVRIHPNSKPVVLTVYKGNDKRNFEVHNPFKFGDFRTKKILEELGIHSTLPVLAPEQASSQLLRRKRGRMKLEPKICIPALECNMSLPRGVPFVNNMFIEEPEYGMFFIDVFRDEDFQRISDIKKVGVETMITYLVMESNITTPENTRLCMKLRKLIADRPDQEKLKSKKVKLEFVGYKLD
ncbi:hypothetical protein Tco_1195040 [Tanacetum coccineum]